jgi:serine phosphatase RsbU (regulator of sigma subunit)
MQLHVDPHAETPIYRQIERQIAEAIADHRLLPGEALVQEEELAARLVVSPASVRKAYEQLESNGLCQSADSDRLRVLTSDPGSRSAGRARRALALLKHELLSEELESAREAQQRLLPPARLTTQSWIAEVRTCPASTLNGDFYDLFELGDGGLGVVVADVAGKGLAAGLLMAVAKSMLPFIAPELGAAETLQELNRRLCPILGRREFIALAYARLCPRGESVELANAGLPDPYLIRAGLATPLTPPGPRLPLGVRAQLPYTSVRCRLTSRDRIFFTTDGIAEARGADGEPVGYEGLVRLVRSLSRCAAQPDPGRTGAGSWLDELVARVRALTGPLPEDDWTALLVESRAEGA